MHLPSQSHKKSTGSSSRLVIRPAIKGWMSSKKTKHHIKFSIFILNSMFLCGFDEILVMPFNFTSIKWAFETNQGRLFYFDGKVWFCLKLDFKWKFIEEKKVFSTMFHLHALINLSFYAHTIKHHKIFISGKVRFVLHLLSFKLHLHNIVHFKMHHYVILACCNSCRVWAMSICYFGSQKVIASLAIRLF